MLAQDVGDLDRLAEALKTDGVVIDSLLGSGEPTDSHDRIAALIREVPFPVYVALVDQPEDLGVTGPRASEALAALMHRRIGGGALYVTSVKDGVMSVNAFGLGTDETLLSLVMSSNEGKVEDAAKRLTHAEYAILPPVVESELIVLEAEAAVAKARDVDGERDWEATVSDEEAEVLGERMVALETSSNWRPESASSYGGVREASKGLAVAAGVLVGFLVALFLGQTMFGWPRRTPAEARAAAEKRRRTHGAEATPPLPAALVPDFATERDRARTALDSFVARLERTASAPVQDHTRVEQALLARDVAELVLADAESNSDALAAVGAFTLARTGDRDLSRGLDGRTVPFRPCYFDPRHGHTTLVHAWEFGEGSVQVPCCSRCRTSIDAGKAPSSLHRASRRGDPRPYWQDDDVWASTGFGALDEEYVATVARARRGRR